MKRNKLLVVPLLLSLIGMVGCDGNTSSSQASSSQSSSSQTSSSQTTSSQTSSNSQKQLQIVGVNQKKSITDSLSNKGEKTNKQEEFVNRTNPYYVGDDNVFNIKPTVLYVDNNKLPVSKDDTTFNITLEIKNNNVFEKVEDINQYLDSIDKTACDLNFNENAIGKTFKISVVPTDAPENSIAKFTQTLEVVVVDGFNVYNAKELGYFNNNLTTTKEAWTTFMSENNLNNNNEIKSIVLQNNISITKDDIPSYFMYSAKDLKDNFGISETSPMYKKYLGSLKDQYEGIYHRNFQDKDETFSLYGNYFKLDASTLPLVKLESGKKPTAGENDKVVSHTTLFKTKNINEDNNKYIFNISDLTIIGNASRRDDTSLSGGLIFHKSGHMVTNFNNNISRCWFITNFPEYNKSKYVINNSKEYDNFNSFIYNWGGTVEINNSEMTGTGGPIIIQDHVNPNQEDTHIGKSVINNSKLENWVAGTEGWFDLFNVSTLTGNVIGLDLMFNNYGKTYTRNKVDGTSTFKQFNLICVNKSGGDAGISSEKISGSITINNKTMDYGETDQMFGALYNGVNSQNASAPIFRTTENNSFAYTDGKTGLYKLDSSMKPTPITLSDNVLKGDYLNMYYSGMFFTLGYYDLTK